MIRGLFGACAGLTVAVEAFVAVKMEGVLEVTEVDVVVICAYVAVVTW